MNTTNSKDSENKLDWLTIYSDLSARTANALREARIKPSQLITMTDGEITSIEGIGEVGLEEIRSNYAADIMTRKEETGKEEVKAEKPEEGKEKTDPSTMPANKRHLHKNSKKYIAAKNKIDKSKLYSIKEAIQLIKEVNIANFNSTVSLHLVTRERIPSVEVEFPYSTGKTKKIEIATDELINKIEKGEIEFDILIASPEMMPKLAKYAKILGPRGLMPNPKAGTITNNPKEKIKELESGKTLVKSEPKAPLMHIVIGKVEQKEEELINNLNSLITAVKPRNIVKAVIASTMSPGIKIFIEK